MEWPEHAQQLIRRCQSQLGVSQCSKMLHQILLMWAPHAQFCTRCQWRTQGWHDVTNWHLMGNLSMSPLQTVKLYFLPHISSSGSFSRSKICYTIFFHLVLSSNLVSLSWTWVSPPFFYIGDNWLIKCVNWLLCNLQFWVDVDMKWNRCKRSLSVKYASVLSFYRNECGGRHE